LHRSMRSSPVYPLSKANDARESVKLRRVRHSRRNLISSEHQH
jgi:hypothetical protein